MTAVDDLTKKEKKLFIAGVLAGIVGGLLSNLLAAFIMEILKMQPQPTWAVIIEFLIVLAGFVWIVYKLANKMEKIDNE